MSSMLKKGTGAFKPKAPVARRRPLPSSAPATPVPDEPTPTESQSQPQSKATTPAQATPPSAPLHGVANKSTTTDSTSIQPTPAASAEAPLSPSHSQTTTATATNETNVADTKESVESTSDNVQPAASNVTPREASTKPAVISEDQPAPAQDLTGTTAPANAAPASHKDTPAQARPGRSVAYTKPRPIAETTAPEAPSAPPPETVSVASESEVTAPPTDNGEGASVSAAPKGARKPTARKSTKRKAPAATGESEAEAEAETGTETVGPPKKKRAPRKKKNAAATDGEDGRTEADSVEKNGESAAPKKRVSRKKQTASEENGEQDGDYAGGEAGEEKENEGVEDTERARKDQARRKRSVTPEGAERQTVDHDQMVMSDLTKDLKIGAKFSKYDELRDRIRKKRARQRLIKLGKLQLGVDIPDDGSGGGGSEAGTPAPDSVKSTATPVPTAQEREREREQQEGQVDAGMPRLVMRDGQLTLDEGTTQYDRYAEADAARGVLPEHEEDEFTTPVTQSTYMRRQPQGNFWTNAETVKFYHGLRMFGTDFNTIAKMFGGAKNRRQVKLKFNREERANPVAVNRCIIGEKVVPMALEAVDGAGALEDSKAITDELDRLKEAQEAETRRQEEEKAAENQRRRDELFGKRKGDRDKAHHRDHRDEKESAGHHHHHRNKDDAGDEGMMVQERALHPGSMYGVGTDPDVIDETDLPSASARGRGRARRGGKAPPMLAGGIGG